MVLTVNGEERIVAPGLSVAELLVAMQIDPEATGTAVALNLAVVRRAEWRRTSLTAGDEVEIVTATQGG